MVHPVQSVIESLYAAGRCPRLHVNAVFEGVVCPDFIREQWQERLIIDLDPSYPLDLTFEDDGLAADLSFGGYVTRCTFPYGAVYVVADRSTGRGIVLDQNMPESVKRARTNKSALSSLSSKPSLHSVPADDHSPVPPPSIPAAAPVTPAKAPAAQISNAAPPVNESGDEEVKKRRAGFRVIDGGNS